MRFPHTVGFGTGQADQDDRLGDFTVVIVVDVVFLVLANDLPVCGNDKIAWRGGPYTRIGQVVDKRVRIEFLNTTTVQQVVVFGVTGPGSVDKGFKDLAGRMREGGYHFHIGCGIQTVRCRSAAPIGGRTLVPVQDLVQGRIRCCRVTISRIVQLDEGSLQNVLEALHQ